MKRLSCIGLSLLLVISIASRCEAGNDIDQEVETLIGQLGADQSVRTEAGRKLASYGKQAVPALIRAFESNDSEVRISAGAVLAMIGEDAIPDILNALKHNKTLVREHAVMALNRDAFGIDSLSPRTITEIVNGLIGALRDPEPEVRRSAANALDELGSESARAVPALTFLLRNEKRSDMKSSEVREAVIHTLGKIGSQAWEAVPALIESFKDAPETHVTGLAYNICSASFTLAEIGKAAIEPLISSLSDPDVRVRCYAADSLGFMKTDDEAAVQALVNALDDGRPVVRVRAAAAIENIGLGAHNATHALQLALKDKNDSVRSAAADAIGKMGEYAKDAVPELVAMMNNPKEYEAVRKSAINAVGDLGQNASSATSSLVNALDGPIGVRESAYAALGRVATENIPVLREKLADTNTDMRFRVLSAESITKIVERLLEGRVENIPVDKLNNSIGDVEACREFVIGFGPDYRYLVERLNRSFTSLRREQDRRQSDKSRMQAYLIGSSTLALGVVAFAILASVQLRRRLLVLLGRRWIMTFAKCDGLIEITDTTITIRPSLGSDATCTRFPAMWPPQQAVLETIREMLPGSDIRVAVDRSLFRQPWAYHLGGRWADGLDTIIAGQLCAVPESVKLRPVYTKKVAFAAFSCSRPENRRPLEAVDGEIDAVTSCFRRWGASVYCCRDSATVSDVCDGLLNADIMHVAAHATTAGIILQDGVLGTRELNDGLVSKLRCRLLVLSGCEAGRLDEDDSFVYTLVQTGVNVIAAVDFVKDQACRTFFEEFYSALLPGRRTEGVELGAAIRSAAEACSIRFGEVEASLQVRGQVERWKKSVNSFMLYGDPSIHLILQIPK
jgi:HEAT repeat protein